MRLREPKVLCDGSRRAWTRSTSDRLRRVGVQDRIQSGCRKPEAPCCGGNRRYLAPQGKGSGAMMNQTHIASPDPCGRTFQMDA